MLSAELRGEFNEATGAFGGDGAVVAFCDAAGDGKADAKAAAGGAPRGVGAIETVKELARFRGERRIAAAQKRRLIGLASA